MEDPKNEALVVRSMYVDICIYQTIGTRVLPATNTLRDRIAVTTGSGLRRVYSLGDLVECQPDLQTGYIRSQLHREAARRLISELSWPAIGHWAQGGQMGKFDHVFTCCHECKAHRAL
jgi:hypothetical protein